VSAHTEASLKSRRLHAGCRSCGLQGSPELIPEASAAFQKAEIRSGDPNVGLTSSIEGGADPWSLGAAAFAPETLFFVLFHNLLRGL
jgi:hypothetical protein